MVNYIATSLSFLQVALLVSANPISIRTTSTSTCSAAYSKTQSDFQTVAKNGVYQGQTAGAAANGKGYLAYKLVKDTAECKAYCDSESACKYYNIYQDQYPEGETPSDLPPSAQEKYVIGSLTCSIYSQCQSNSDFTNWGGQNDPSFITKSYGYCKDQQCCTSSTYSQTQKCFQAKAPSGVYKGKKMGAAASDSSYLTYKLVKSQSECKTYCDSVKDCVFANLYQDQYPAGETPSDLTPEVQAKYKKGNLTCAVFSKCLSDSSFNNFGGQNDPSFITESYGFCKGTTCKTV